MPTAEQLAQFVLPTYARYSLVPVRGEGSWLYDETGRRYLDFCAGIAVCSLGHCHPKVTQAIQDQSSRLVHCSNLYQIPQQARLAQTIVEQFVKLPGKVFFSNSGAEANDGLIKTARRYGHAFPMTDGKPRYEILTFMSSFHGRTLGSMAATGQDKIKIGFDPMLPGFRHLPFNDLGAVCDAISPETVAILIEPVQGEGGVNPAKPEFLRGLAALCRERNLLLFFDEIQTGICRCGEPMGWTAIAPEVVPDGISFAKGLGGGFPIGAFWVSDRAIGSSEKSRALSSLMDVGSHGSTYGGNPLGTATSQAVLDELLAENCLENVRRQNARIFTATATWKYPAFTEVRGLGLLLGFGLNSEAFSVPEGKTHAAFVVEKLMAAGLLCVAAGPNTVRWLPPLNVSDEEISLALEIMEKALADL